VVEPQPFGFDIALAFVDALPVEEAEHYLRERVRQIEGAVRRLDRWAEERMRQEAAEGRRALSGALVEHQRVHLEAELNWTRVVLERMERGLGELADLPAAIPQP
jgi:hypothetical protein